VDVFLKHGVYN